MMKIMERLTPWRSFMALAFLFCIYVTLQTLAHALPYGSGTYGSCQYSSCGITVSSSTTVNIDASPTAAGVYTVQSDSVTVTTASSTGYTLTLIDSDNNTSLVNGSMSITASTGTPTIPSTLSLNTWGYRVDGVDGFGAGPTSAQSNASTSSFTFAGVPANNQSAQTIGSQNGEASAGVTTKVWYGVRVNSTISSGSYMDQVTYTATTN